MMSPETIEVLQHWRKNWDLAVEGKLDLSDITAHRCDYCDLFVDADCIKCPVYKKTGKAGCLNSPWELLFDHVVFSSAVTLSTETVKKHTWAELQFLLQIAYEEMMETQ